MNSIFSAKSVLVVVDPKMKIGDYLAFTVFLDLLKKNVPNVDLLNLGKFIDPQLNAVRPPEVNSIEKIEPKKYILSFDKGDESIKNIQWHQTDEKINIYVSMDNGQFSTTGMHLDSEGSDYDTVIYYGVNDYETVAPRFSNYPALVSEAKNIAFGVPFAIPHAKLELVRPEPGQTNSELVLNTFKGKGMTPEHYSRLLAGIMASTRRFADESISTNIFSICAELIANGASLARANAILDRKKNSGNNSGNRDRKDSKKDQHQKSQDKKQENPTKDNRPEQPKQANVQPQPAPTGNTPADSDPLPKASDQPAQPIVDDASNFEN